MERQRVSTGTEWEPKVGYSRAVRVGDRVLVSGTTATDDEGDPIAPGDPGVQTRRALQMVADAVEEAGGRRADIVRTRMYVTDADVLTQRRVTDLISELDMLGIVNAVVVSKGRYGRTKEISLSVPLDETEAVLLSDSRVGEVEDAQPFVQARFDN